MSAPRGARRRTALLLGVACFFVYLANLRVMGSWDVIPARYLPFSILRQANVDLNEFPWLGRLDAVPYFLRQTADGRLVSRYPIVTPLAVTPLYAPAVWWLQAHEVGNDDVRFRLAAVTMERIAAAAIAALTVTFVCLALFGLAPAGLAVGTTLVFALGTNMWSGSSQALWQHGLAALGLAGMNLCFLGPSTRRGALAASLFAALAVLARPTMIIFAALALLFMWRERRPQLAAFLGIPLVGAAALLAYNLAAVGRLLGGYAGVQLYWPSAYRLAGLLVSPNRGLLIYTPVAALVAPTIVRLATTPARRRSHPWLVYLAIGIGGYLLVYSAFWGWWAGYSYGPRFLSDLLPAMALLAAPTVESLWRRASGRALIIALAAWGIVIQAIGVYCYDRSWDALPVPVDAQPGRVWDWYDPQIIRAARTGWHGFELAPAVWQALRDPRPVTLRPLSRDDLMGAITVTSPLPLRAPGSSHAAVMLDVANGATTPWPAFSDYGYLQVQILYSWWLNGQRVGGEGGFIPLPRNLYAGETLLLDAHVDTPALPGSYQLDLAVVQLLDQVQGTAGNASVRVPVQVD